MTLINSQTGRICNQMIFVNLNDARDPIIRRHVFSDWIGATVSNIWETLRGAVNDNFTNKVCVLG